MNPTEHLLTCLGEEGAEIAQQCAKANRFTLSNRNPLVENGQTNTERIVDELNDLLGVAQMLVADGLLPADWQSTEKQTAKIAKVKKLMEYAARVGALQWPVGTRIRFLKNILDVGPDKSDLIRALKDETGIISGTISTHTYWAKRDRGRPDSFTVSMDDEFEVI